MHVPPAFAHASINPGGLVRLKEVKEGGKGGGLLLGLTTRWPSESEGAKGREGGEADKKKVKQKLVSLRAGGGGEGGR